MYAVLFLQLLMSLFTCFLVIKVPVYENRKKSDPVSLYHHYSTLWQKYKTNLPGENDWADIRWSVRERLLGDKQSQDLKKVRKNIFS